MTDKIIAWSSCAYRTSAPTYNSFVLSQEGEPVYPTCGYIQQALLILWAKGVNYSLKDIRKAQRVLRSTPCPKLCARARSLTPIILERSKLSALTPR